MRLYVYDLLKMVGGDGNGLGYELTYHELVIAEAG